MMTQAYFMLQIHVWFLNKKHTANVKNKITFRINTVNIKFFWKSGYPNKVEKKNPPGLFCFGFFLTESINHSSSRKKKAFKLK